MKKFYFDFLDKETQTKISQNKDINDHKDLLLQIQLTKSDKIKTC